MAIKIFFCLVFAIVRMYSLEIKDSGFDETPPFSTVTKFFLEISSDSDTVSVIPDKCCLHIEPNDTDCQVLNLGARKNVLMPKNQTVRVSFPFRNLYVRYRRGQCRFSVESKRKVTGRVSHVIPFSTYPIDYVANCSGIDQDPDRGCVPVDCAIKYKGHRSYYNVTIGKCEPVPKCNTRGKDGVTVIAYYDWETNKCVEYKWFSNPNYFNQIESDAEIPVDIDPSQMKYYPDLEPQLMNASSVVLDCNHGIQSGMHCECDEGWISSGIHHDSPLAFHWCDQPMMVSASLTSHPPHKLNKLLEYFCVSVSFPTNCTFKC